MRADQLAVFLLFLMEVSAHRRVSAQSSICRLPILSGDGDDMQNRWAYSMGAGACVEFRFSGDGGNANNFR